MPAVLVGLTGNTDGLTCVDLDFEAAGAACVDHLADLGHREIALVGESPSVYRRHAGFAARTLAGFRRRARERGLRALYRPCDAGFESVAGALMGILGERPTATGFVVQNENAVGPLPRLLDRHGRAVPDDVSVVAICPDQLARNASPPLTCVPIPAEEMGRTAVELVMARLAGRSTGGATLIRPELVVRDSSRALSRPPGS
jgi:DNA-binding LacI/PurR family transcriptional regulator